MTKFVTAYEVTRHFGGPEEGGWWYNAYDPIATVATGNPEAVVKEFKARYEDREVGNIYSVLGGVAIEGIIEDKAAENRTIERPHYS